MKRSLWVLLGSLVVFTSVGTSLADPIPGIVNTGNLSNGSPAGIGNADAWGGFSVNPNAVGDAWITPGAGATWTTQDHSGGTAVDAFPFNGPTTSANYNYGLNFNLQTAGLDATTAQISYSFAVDNDLTVKLNGVTVQTFNAGGAIDAAHFQSMHAGVLINSGFIQGANTLQFIVTNLTSGFNPEGLLVFITGTANPLRQNIPDPAPEPASVLLWGIAGAGACISAWRRTRRNRT